MSQWDEASSDLDQYAEQATAPNAPKGLRQAATAGAGVASGAPGWDLNQLGAGVEESGYMPQAQSWFTGANMLGEQNGWDTDFFNRTIAQYNQVAAEGGLNEQFDRPDATGIVTWDHVGAAGDATRTFGDVYDEGKKVGNVYEQFDQGTADAMMAKILFDGVTQGRIFAEGGSQTEINERLGAAVQGARETNNANVAATLKQADFEGKVDATEEKFTEGNVDEAIVGGSTAASALTGAAAGFVVAGPVGAAVGGLGFGAAGFVGGLLNKDELTEQAARAYEITALADREQGTLPGLATGLQQWAGFTTKLTSPLTNVSHGVVELQGDNKIGDRESAFYAQNMSKPKLDAAGQVVLDKEGNMVMEDGPAIGRSWWNKPLSLGAAVGDGLIQFVSPLNRAVYASQMGGQIAGESAQLGLTGTMFDPREGGFDNIFKDDEGNADPASGAAGIMKIGIDAVQMTGFLALARTSGRQAASVARGEQIVEAAGHRFVLDASGKAISRKKNYFTLMAPSEQIAAANASREARVAAYKRAAAGDSYVVTADDFYRAATAMATSPSAKLKQAMINGFGEGYEEVAQGILEPIAMDGRLDPMDLTDSFLAGAAGGVGMSLGATFTAPTSDERLKSQAYVLETLRRGGVEPDAADWDSQWEGATQTEKQVMATRSAADIKVTQQSLKRTAESQAATLITSGVDAAKAIDSKRSRYEKDLESGSIRTDAYHVMTGRLSAGRVDVNGDLTGDSVPAEALEASALTIGQLLENRLNGFEIQAQQLGREITRLQGLDQSVPENVTALAEAESLLDQAILAHKIGENILGNVGTLVAQIYDENTSKPMAQMLTQRLNAMLESLFDGTATVTAPADEQGRSPEELVKAAQKFISLLHSREPKLDSGSYLSLMPWASWDLTESNSHNMVQVNVDVLQAINGDFDGDKLRAENQLILTDERFLQSRAGQLFAGAGREIDMGTQAFDGQLTKALGVSLVGQKSSALQAEAEGVMHAIESAVTRRYGNLMSPAALDIVFTEFRTAVRGGDEDARITLVNALAREAGGAITDLGREQMSNEWLWISKVVRANFQEFQTNYRRLRNPNATGPSMTVDVEDIDTPVGINARKDQAVTDAQTLALFAVGNTLFRKFQKVHYSSYNSSVLTTKGVRPSDMRERAALYEELSRGVTEAELSRVQANDRIGARVLAMLDRLVSSALEDPSMAALDPNTALTVLANVKVKDVWFVGDEAVTDGKNLSLVQLLLKRALDADRLEHKLTFETDEALQARHAKLRAMTKPNEIDGGVYAERAFLEVFGGVPFADSLGRSTGALAPHATPEQWLRRYQSMESAQRAQFEKEYTGQPEYLARKDRSNLPYSMGEALNRSVSPYRSMMDAMLAVGRSELTFNPDVSYENALEAFGGRKWNQSLSAMDDFREGYDMVQEALQSFRTMRARTKAKSVDEVTLIQELFATNDSFARTVLDQIPDAAANAIYEYRDNRLWVSPWVYEMYAMTNSEEALFHYWKHLTLAQWRSTQVTGRSYNELQFRFQRLLSQLAREPGQMHMELLMRKMDEFKNLAEFFLWLNKTPGFRGQQAPLLPFNDDVADFEADGTGGWVTARASGDIRLAIAAARRAAENLRDTMQFREENEATDRLIRKGIRRALTDDPRTTEEDRENLRRLQKAIEVSHVLPRGFAPSAMLALTSGALRGYDPHSTDKGVTSDSFKPMGEFQALMDAYGFMPGVERVMEALTAHSIGSLRNNVGDMSKEGGTAMDADGRQVEWERMTVEQALDMMDDPRSAGLAFTLLTPRALDIANGKMTERLLHDANLKSLLDPRNYSDLFALDGDKSFNKAMKYLFYVDSRARAAGGHFDVIRYVNSLAAARTSGLGRPATPDDMVRIRNQAYLDTARALQTVGQVLSTEQGRDSTALTDLRDAAVKQMRGRRKARALPGFTESDSGKLMEQWVQEIIADLQEVERGKIEVITQTHTGAEMNRLIALVEAEYQVSYDRLNAALEDDVLSATRTRFELTGDPVNDAANKARIIEYARTLPPSRMPESLDIWSRMMQDLESGVPVSITEEEWGQISRSLMGIHLVDSVIPVASHITVPPFFEKPEEGEHRFHKYFDPSYSWIVTDLIADDTSLAEAATWMHTVGEQPRVIVPMQKMLKTLESTILNEKGLGTWTPGLMSQITESHLRMDSAGAEPGVQGAGNGPKRNAFTKAMRRNVRRVPGPELLTTATLTGDLLAESASLFNEIAVTPTGSATPTTMPVAQLDNRFVAALRVNGNTVSLNTMNLGFQTHLEETDSGYRYVALPRLRQVLERMAEFQGLRLSDLDIEIDFFHPDSRPEGKEWMNNAYFDGMNHSLLPDNQESLLAGLWSDNGGMISLATQRVLDAGKKGLRAIAPYVKPNQAAIVEADAKWTRDNDFAAMLRAKTKIVMEYDDGFGSIIASDPSFYNAVYKQISVSHIVVGVRDNAIATMTAEEVIAFQAANPGQPLPLEGAKLVKLSPDVIRSVVGDVGDQAAQAFTEAAFEPNVRFEEYTGPSEEAIARFGVGWLSDSISVVETSLTNAGMQRTLKVRSQLTDAERNAQAERIEFLNSHADKVGQKRYDKLKGVDANNSYLAVLQLAMGNVSLERNTFDFLSNNIPIAPRMTEEASHTMMLMETLKGIKNPTGLERGWIVEDGTSANHVSGLLNIEALDKSLPPQHQVALGDIALLRLNTFQRPDRDVDLVFKRVDKALSHLTNYGATVSLGEGNGGGDLRDYAARWLVEHNYVPVAGAKHLFVPAEYSFESQNERAYGSTFTETAILRPNRHSLVFLSKDAIGTTENNSALNPLSTKLRSRKLVNNLLPSSYASQYNLLFSTGMTSLRYAETLQHLREATDPKNTENRDVLLAMAGADPAGRMGIEEALDRFHRRISDRTSLLPEVGDSIQRGDIIPFVDSQGRTILYRHGFKMPKQDELADLQRNGGLNIALATSETEPAATANDGMIVSVEPRAGFGRTLAIEVDLQAYGDKIQLDENGMKYTLVPPSEALKQFMRLPVFANGTVVDLWSDLPSATSKEAFSGLVMNMRNGLAMFQFDFTEDLVKFFFPDPASRDANATVLTISMLEALQNDTTLEITKADARAMAKARTTVGEHLGDFAAAQATLGVPVDWSQRLVTEETAEAAIARAVIAYLLTRGATYENVLKSEGFSGPKARTDRGTVRLVPGLFADILDGGFDTPVHKELIRRFDAQFKEENGAGFQLNPDWSVTIHDGPDTLEGYLMFSEAHSSGDNPSLDGQAFDGTEPQGVSLHNSMASALSVDAITAHSILKKSTAFAKSFLQGGKMPKLTGTGESLWDALTYIPQEKDSSLAGWRRERPAETVRRSLARDEIIGFYHPVDQSGWTQFQRDEYEAATKLVYNTLNLLGKQPAMMDTWVRQGLGRPYAVFEGTERGVIGGDDAVQEAKRIRDAVLAGNLPTAGARVPLMDVNQLTQVYLANYNRADGWKPNATDDTNPEKADSWNAWVEVAFGTAWIMPPESFAQVVPEPLFDSMYLLAVDGLMHGYQGASSSTRSLPVSTDILRQRQLMDVETNRMLVSISADENILATDPTLFNSTQATLEEIIGGSRIYASGRGGHPDPASAQGRQDKRIERWQADKPAPVQRKIRGVRQEGQTFIAWSTRTSTFFRSMTNIRAGNSLFNVTLMVWAPIEAMYRRTIDLGATTLTGEGTGGVAKVQSRISQALGRSETYAEVAKRFGWEMTYTPDDFAQMDKLVAALATRPDFKAMIYKEIMHQYPTMKGIGKVEKWLEKYASTMARAQDPTWGLLPTELARLYLEVVMRENNRMLSRTDNVYSPAMLRAGISRDPEWVLKQDHEAHNLAIAAIANRRSVKANVLSLGLRGVVEPMANNPRWAINATGNFTRLLTLFQNFWANSTITMMGLQGPADFAAFWLDGRRKSKLTRRMQAAIGGTVFVPEDHEFYDMSEALESLDLADAFIRGGVTHTALFTLGMLAGSLGLSGEDDEEKWRRRAAEQQGAGYIRDPRDLVNDFRNKDAIYLDAMPFGLDSLFRDKDGSAGPLAQMTWTTRYFMAPIIGMERFYQTGDFTEVVHGFGSALGAHPIVNAQLWNEATDTVAELHMAANDAMDAGDDQQSAHLLITAVGVMERMLLENSMINMVYIGADRYDRDPYALPERDSDGNLQVDVRNNPYETNTALQEFVDDKGTADPRDDETRTGYVGRDQGGATLRSFTENRFSLALITSLASGLVGKGFQDSDLFRYSMPVKVRDVELMPTDPNLLRADISAALQGAMRETNIPVTQLTETEAAQIIKNWYQARNIYWDATEVERQAKSVVAANGLYGMSEIKNGREYLTTDGQRAIFDGLRKGTVQLGDGSLNGVFMTPPEREAIRDAYVKDITQEGVDLGLSLDQATWRMRRIVFGTGTTSGTPNLNDLIWTDAIPYTDKLEYNQMNTTYVMGPDGLPWATGFKREGFFGAIGLKPLNTQWTAEDMGLKTDSTLNAVDDVVGINLGLRALEPRGESWEIPTIEEITKEGLDEILKAIEGLDLSPTAPYAKPAGTGYGSGWRNFGSGGGYRRRSYGGYSGGGGGYFTRMYALPGINIPYGNNIPFINTSNPLLRRADIRRERIWSERGRLKQWQ